MSQQEAGFLASSTAADIFVLAKAQAMDARREPPPAGADDAGLIAAADRDHLERELAAIERAAAALRRAEPELESWTDMPAPPTDELRPIWLLIGALWLSTAVATIGAVFAISLLVG